MMQGGMLRAALAVAAALVLMFAALIGGVTRTRGSVEPGGAVSTLAAQLGIAPGRTHVDEAIALLEDHPWVATLHFHRGMAADSGFMRWTWTGAQPEMIDARRDGGLWINEGDVAWVEIALTLALGDLWLAGTPSFSAPFATSVSPPRIRYQAVFETWMVEAGVPCPLNPRGFWGAPTVIRIHGSAGMALADRQLGAIVLPDWGAC